MHWPTLRELVIELAILLGVTLAVAFMGPFGTFALGGFPDRLGYWALMLFGGYVVIRPLMVLAPLLQARLAFSEAVVWIGLIVAGGVPLTLLVWFGGGGTRLPHGAEFLTLYPNVVLLGGLVAFIFWLRRARRTGGTARADVPEPLAAFPPEPAACSTSRGPPLLQRLPPHQRGPLRALEMEDHYVRVHTAAGAHMLLMRMRDAVAETAGEEGMQVHRSWWVARGAVVGHRREGRNLRLLLEDGLSVPVARGSIDTLAACGWLV